MITFFACADRDKFDSALRKDLFEGKEGNWRGKWFSVEKNDTGKVEEIGPKKPLSAYFHIGPNTLKIVSFLSVLRMSVKWTDLNLSKGNFERYIFDYLISFKQCKGANSTECWPINFKYETFKKSVTFNTYKQEWKVEKYISQLEWNQRNSDVHFRLLIQF